ncbi:MAG: hypothetical protein IKX88_07170, partial [Thermoguttaceae bacterium]|nr:hypothetical protein [Thermoguttaceae bacterium]
MAKLASVFFLISDSLLWPVMIGLLLGLALAVWRFGKTLRISIERRRESKVVKQVTDALEKKQIKEAEELLRSSAFSRRTSSV